MTREQLKWKLCLQEFGVCYAFVEFEDIFGVQTALQVWTNIPHHTFFLFDSLIKCLYLLVICLTTLYHTFYSIYFLFIFLVSDWVLRHTPKANSDKANACLLLIRIHISHWIVCFGRKIYSRFFILSILHHLFFPFSNFRDTVWFNIVAFQLLCLYKLNLDFIGVISCLNVSTLLL